MPTANYVLSILSIHPLVDFFHSCRLRILVALFTAGFLHYTMRMSLNMAVVCMVKTNKTDHMENNASYEQVSGNFTLKDTDDKECSINDDEKSNQFGYEV